MHSTIIYNIFIGYTFSQLYITEGYAFLVEINQIYTHEHVIPYKELQIMNDIYSLHPYSPLGMYAILQSNIRKKIVKLQYSFSRYNGGNI